MAQDIQIPKGFLLTCIVRLDRKFVAFTRRGPANMLAGNLERMNKRSRSTFPAWREQL
jgi:hypothetical protein